MYEEEIASSGYTRTRRVLVIDDSPTARASIRALLEQAGWEVHDLPSAIGATRTILRKRIDAVVVDISMPGLSGDKLVAMLRSNVKLAALSVVIVTGLPSEELVAVREKLPADAVISKAHIHEELVPSLQRSASLRRMLAVRPDEDTTQTA